MIELEYRQSMTPTNNDALTSFNLDQSLSEIGRRLGCDKISHHEYDRYYPVFLERFRRCKNWGMFEIGLEQGRSLAMWLEYFPDVFVYGIDISKSYEGQRHKTFIADQSKIESLKELISSQIKHPISLIVDDGSHLPEHQALSFNFLFDQLLQPGGVYIVEDVEVSYWTRGGLYGYSTHYGYRHPASIIEIFKHVIDSLNDEFITRANGYALALSLNRWISPLTRNQIATITFGRNCIIVVKKQKTEIESPRREYRFRQNL